jgi:hypothetical protein
MTDYLRKQQVRARYDVATRTIDRKSSQQERRLPPPEHPLGDTVPLWKASTLDAWDALSDAQRAKLSAEARKRDLTDAEFIQRILAVASEPPQPQRRKRKQVKRKRAASTSEATTAA